MSDLFLACFSKLILFCNFLALSLMLISFHILPLWRSSFAVVFISFKHSIENISVLGTFLILLEWCFYRTTLLCMDLCPTWVESWESVCCVLLLDYFVQIEGCWSFEQIHSLLRSWQMSYLSIGGRCLKSLYQEYYILKISFSNESRCLKWLVFNFSKLRSLNHKIVVNTKDNSALFCIQPGK